MQLCWRNVHRNVTESAISGKIVLALDSISESLMILYQENEKITAGYSIYRFELFIAK